MMLSWSQELDGFFPYWPVADYPWFMWLGFVQWTVMGNSEYFVLIIWSMFPVWFISQLSWDSHLRGSIFCLYSGWVQKLQTLPSSLHHYYGTKRRYLLCWRKRIQNNQTTSTHCKQTLCKFLSHAVSLPSPQMHSGNQWLQWFILQFFSFLALFFLA